jgi:hypothetical protein
MKRMKVSKPPQWRQAGERCVEAGSFGSGGGGMICRRLEIIFRMVELETVLLLLRKP